MDRQELNSLRARVGQVKALLRRAFTARGQQQGELLEEAVGCVVVLENQLERAGAERPASLPQAPDVPLRLLDTPANRLYARKLREAWEAGLAVDRERFGEDIGTDGCAQVVEMVLADVEMEISGPAGRDETRVGR